MKYRIHFEDDSFVVEAETIEEIRKKSFEELEKRNVNLLKNSCWSEAIE